MNLNKVSRWLKPLALLAVAALVWENPLTTKEAIAQTPVNVAQGVNSNSIRINVPPPERTDNRICASDIDLVIDSVIKSRSFASGRWGILVESLNNKTTIYSHNPDTLLIPASNIKLLTTAAALQKFDPRAKYRSTSLGEWINVTNLRSNNNYADALLRSVGGPRGAQEALRQLGVNSNGYRQVDGSGLSRQNAATPRSLITLLRAMNFTNTREAFYSSLPVAGVSGTLRNRLRNTSAQGRVYAKTGTLWGVRALSGYLVHPDYGTILFSILVNHPRESSSLVGAIDEIVLQLSRMTPCR
ncbi:MAG: hypothetical protein F6J86_07390 [Symploca sp. SIO1B1]|nr:hypothetical protein [Symploca sp. SIO1C2]NER93650.1 hypothetical protein [Symploca sp. SIO1B1]